MAIVITPDTIDFTKYLRETDNQTKVKKASDYIDYIKKRLRTKKDQKVSYLPWDHTKESHNGYIGVHCTEQDQEETGPTQRARTH